MTTPKPLSPAAQAVQNAAYRVGDPHRSPHDELDLPAVIRELAQQLLKRNDLTDTFEDILRGAERSRTAGWLYDIAIEMQAVVEGAYD